MFRLREKAKELWDWLYTLEEEKYDHEQRINRQKYDVSLFLFAMQTFARLVLNIFAIFLLKLAKPKVSFQKRELSNLEKDLF